MSDKTPRRRGADANSGCFVIYYHPRAERELKRIADGRERIALLTVVDKLYRIGSRLTEPHAKPIQGASGLHELRPRSGRSVWRLLFANVGDEFAILAVTRTARVRRHEFQAAVQRARRRAKDFGLAI
jgi:hypothetical protein